MSDRLPTALWLEAQLKTLQSRGVFYYVLNAGEHASGMVMVKINALNGTCALQQQQRDFETNELGWVHALGKEVVEENDADAYIRRAVESDPDLWVIEIEDSEMQNPFEGKILKQEF